MTGNEFIEVLSIERLLADSSVGPHRLQRSLGPFSLIALGGGVVISAGIFSLTGIAADDACRPRSESTQFC